MPQTDFSLNDLYILIDFILPPKFLSFCHNMFFICFEKFISNISFLLAFIGNSIFRNEFKDENLKEAIECFSDSYNIYKSIFLEKYYSNFIYCDK